MRSETDPAWLPSSSTSVSDEISWQSSGLGSVLSLLQPWVQSLGGWVEGEGNQDARKPGGVEEKKKKRRRRNILGIKISWGKKNPVTIKVKNIS